MLKQETVQYLKGMGLNVKAGRKYTRPSMKTSKRTTVSAKGFEMFYTLYQTWNPQKAAYDNEYVETNFNVAAASLEELKRKVDEII